MGNCNACIHPESELDLDSTSSPKPKPNRKNQYSTSSPATIRVLKDQVPLSRITDKYTLGRELDRGEFGITYLCTDLETREALACKSISKRKLRTTIDVEDVGREVAIMAVEEWGCRWWSSPPSSLGSHLLSMIREMEEIESKDSIMQSLEEMEGRDMEKIERRKGKGEEWGYRCWSWHPFSDLGFSEFFKNN